MQPLSNELQMPEFNIISKDERDGVLYYYVEAEKEIQIFCPKCGKKCVKYGSVERLVHDLPIYGNPVALRINTNRYRCKNCEKTYSPSFESVEDRAKITRRLREHIGARCLSEPLSRIALDYDVSVATVSRICEEVISEKEKNWISASPAVLGLFDIMIGGRMRILCMDIEESGIIDLLEYSDKNTLKTYLTDKIDATKLNTVIIGFNPEHRDAISEHFQGQNLTIIADRRHLIEMFRNALLQELGRIRAKTLFPLVVKKGEDLNPDELEKLRRSFRRNKGLQTVYDGKERIYDFLKCTSSAKARNAFEKLSTISAECVFVRKVLIQADTLLFEMIKSYDYSYNQECTQEAVELIRKINKHGAGFKFKTLRARLLYAPPQKVKKAKITKRTYRPTGMSLANTYGLTYNHYETEERVVGSYVSIKDVLNLLPDLLG